jgi:hypothetical protein
MLSGQVLRGRQPALVISFVYHAVCHWNLPPGAAAIRAIGAVALGTMHASTVWFHIAENRRLCTTPDSGIIDFFRSKLVLQSARTRGMPTPAARFSFAWISCARTPRYADQQHDSSSILCGYAYGFDREITMITLLIVRRQWSRTKVGPTGQGQASRCIFCLTWDQVFAYFKGVCLGYVFSYRIFLMRDRNN